MSGFLQRVALAVVLVLAATATVAHADGPTRKERKQAAKLIREAHKAKQMGDRYAKRKKFRERAMVRYRKAARAYIDAHAIVQLNPIVFELAVVYDARGEHRWALRGYRRYLELEPDGDFAARASRRAATMENELAGGEEEPGDEDLDPTSVFGDEVETETETETEAEPPRPGRTLRWSGIAAASVGAVFIGLGVKFGGDASSASDELSNKQGAWNDEDRKLIDQGNSAEKKAIAFTLLGVAGIAAGGYLYYLGMKRDQQSTKERLAWVPEVTPYGAALTVVGRF